MGDKRERSQNFSDADRELLMHFVTQKYFSIIENKRTDNSTLKMKHAAWDTLAVDFNAATSNAKRTGIQLRNAYNNLKRLLKKENADDKVELYKTGGGTRRAPNMSDTKARLFDLLKPQLEPLQSRFDSSANFIVKDNEHNKPQDDDLEFEDVQYLDTDEPMKENIEPETFIPPVEYATPLINQPCCSKTLPENAKHTSCETGVGKKRKNKKNATLSDVYENVVGFTMQKQHKSTYTIKKTELEIEILQVKKDTMCLKLELEQEKLKQEKMNTKIKEIELIMKEKELGQYNI